MRLRRLLAFAIGAIGAVAGCSPSHAALPSQRLEACTRFAGELVTGLEWARDHASVYVLTSDSATGDVVIREVDLPGMTSRELTRRPTALALAGLTLGPIGPAWVELPASIWTLGGAGPMAEVTIPMVPYGLRALDSGYLALDPDHAPSNIFFVDRTGDVSVHLHSSRRIESFDASDSMVVYSESDGPGTRLDFVLVTENRRVVRSPAGRLVGNPVLQPGRTDVVFYEDHDAGTFNQLDMTTGAAIQVLHTDVSEARVGIDGRVVHTFVDPAKTDSVCVSDSVTGTYGGSQWAVHRQSGGQSVGRQLTADAGHQAPSRRRGDPMR